MGGRMLGRGFRIVLVAAAVMAGASIIRVHDVRLGVDVAVTAKAMVRKP